ncbi:MAG TPA: DUF4403 family protein [Rhizomicrobium sp.]|jgi:hypothetical protein
MRKTLALFAIPLLAILALPACSKFTAPEPARTPPPPAPPVPVSTVSATLTVPIEGLLRAINDKTATQLADIKDQESNCGIGKCRLDLVATRTGPVTGGAEGGKIALMLPFHVEADVKLKSLFKAKAHAAAEGEARATTSLSLGANWQLVSHTQGEVQMSDADVKLGPLRMRLTELWNHNDEHLSDPLFRALDKRLPEQVKIKPAIERLWARAWQPIKIGKRPEAWLMLTPQRILVGQPLAAGNAITLSVGIVGQARVALGDAPFLAPTAPPLPSPGRLDRPSNRFTFVVPVILPYDQAAKLALARLEKKPPHVGRTQVKFDRLEILPSGKDVIVQTHFCVDQSWDPFGWFDSCGTGYLRGVPVFDSASGTIRIANMRYDVATEGLILSAMKYLAGGELGKALEKNLVFSVAKDLGKLDDEVRTSLAKPQGHGVQIHGTVENFGMPTLSWTDTSFIAMFPATGTVSASFDPNDLNR